MNREECKNVLNITVKIVNGRVPVIAGSNGTNVNEIVDFAQQRFRYLRIWLIYNKLLNC